MALIKNSESEMLVREAVVLDLGDLARQAASIKARAASEAEMILLNARAERERLIKDAAAEGFAEGKREGREAGLLAGLEAGKAEAYSANADLIRKIESGWSAALDDFEQRRTRLHTEARADVVRFALAIARRITRRIVDADPAAVETQLDAALRHVLEPTRLVVLVNPEDAEIAVSALPSLVARLAKSPHIDIRSDPSLNHGDCIIETRGGEIDARIDTQIERICEAIQPGAGILAPTLSAPPPGASLDGSNPQTESGSPP